MSVENSTEQSVREKATPILWPDFLESTPPNQLLLVSELVAKEQKVVDNNRRSQIVYTARTPELQLHCPSDACNGTRFFRYGKREQPIFSGSDFSFFYLTYLCSNCQKTQKTFSIASKIEAEKSHNGLAYKFGEFPAYGPPTPARLIKLIGPDREEFLKGRRCENQGLGVGAFIYYRRVVENQKNRILSEIVRVVEKIGPEPEAIDKLQAAIQEVQFAKALSIAKDALPQSLKINGLNPMSLLHAALSDGVHGRSDEDCLEIASSVRIVLGELSERLSQALKDEVELAKALSTLLNRQKEG